MQKTTQRTVSPPSATLRLCVFVPPQPPAEREAARRNPPPASPLRQVRAGPTPRRARRRIRAAAAIGLAVADAAAHLQVAGIGEQRRDHGELSPRPVGQQSRSTNVAASRSRRRAAARHRHRIGKRTRSSSYAAPRELHAGAIAAEVHRRGSRSSRSPEDRRPRPPASAARRNATPRRSSSRGGTARHSVAAVADDRGER